MEQPSEPFPALETRPAARERNAAMACLRILLFTPYTGGNLGDAAIQDAIVYHFRKRLMEPQISLVTLSPDATSKLHWLPSFPIASRAHDGNPGLPAGTVPGNSFNGIKSKLRRVSWLYRVLALGSRSLRAAGNFPRRAGLELRHVLQVYRLLKKTDLLVMSGGGQIDDYWGGPFGQPYALFKWASLARLAGTPVAFPSVGVCSLASGWSRFFAYRALRLAAYRSYRDRGSKQLLHEATFTHADPEYPDLAFSHPCASEPPPVPSGPDQKCAVIGVSPIAYLSPHGWPERDPVVYDRYLEALGVFARKVLEAGHVVVLFTTSLMDRFAVNDLEAKLRQVPGGWSGRLRRVDQESLEIQIEQIRKMDLVVASRLHGVILSHLVGKPTLAISYDRKVRAHMEAMGQERFCPELRGCTMPQLWDGFTRLRRESLAVSASILAQVKERGEKLDLQYDLLLKLVGKPRCASEHKPSSAVCLH